MKAVLYDSQDKKLSRLWRLGLPFNRTPIDIGAATWEAAYFVLRVHPEIRELHVWSHGRAGAPLIAGQPVELFKLTQSLPNLVGVWWRSCSVHRGAAGHAFAKGCARHGFISVGHTKLISTPLPWRQKSICAYTPNELAAGIDPWWSDQGDELRGCSTFRMKVPRFAYRGEA